MSHVWATSSMASFDMAASMTASISLPGNLPIQRLEPSLHKFTKIAIPTDLERLNQHRRNIEKYHRQGAFDKLDAEQNNARRTVQQLKANMREMEKARHQLREEDHPEFDKRVTPVKQEAIEAIVEFIELYGQELSMFGDIHEPSDDLGREDDSTTKTTTIRQRRTVTQEETDICEQSASNNPDVLSDHMTQSSSTEHDGIQKQTQAQTQRHAAKESWEFLKVDLEQLNTVIHEFAAHVNSQQEKVNNITDNIDQAQLSTREGTTLLVKASKLKSALLPVGGALIGGAIGGPIGFYAGLKIGAIAALGGGAVGFVSGRFLKKKQDKQVNLELDELTNSNDITSRSLSTSSVTSDTDAKKDK